MFKRIKYDGGEEVIKDDVGVTVTNDGLIDIETDTGKKLYTGRDPQAAREAVESHERIKQLYEKGK